MVWGNHNFILRAQTRPEHPLWILGGHVTMPHVGTQERKYVCPGFDLCYFCFGSISCILNTNECLFVVCCQAFLLHLLGLYQTCGFEMPFGARVVTKRAFSQKLLASEILHGF